MPSLLEFLDAVLPANGLKCVVVLGDGKPKQTFFRSVQQLAESIQRSRSGTGEVYFGCASYSRAGRKAADVSAVRSLWLDIDAGPGKDYPDVQFALAALKEFIRDVGLPIPTLVGSGGGLHAYWVLSVDVDVSTWRPLAEGLKAACERHGLKADPTRTADVASILRPPGTFNRKQEPRCEVICGPLQGPYPLEAFDGIRLRNTGEDRILDHRPVGRPARDLRRGGDLAKRLATVETLENIDFGALVRGCAQAREFKENNGVYGNVYEPEFYALLGVLGWCEGGDAQAHEWAKVHPNYNFKYTQDRLERVRRLLGPTTCAKFRSIAPKKCAGCQFGKTTPLEAARELRLVRAPEKVSGVDQPPGSPDAIALPPDFSIRDGGLHYAIEDKNGHINFIKVTSFPVHVRSVHRGEIKKDQVFYLMRHFKPHDGWREMDLAASRFVGQSMVPTMADVGVVVHEQGLFRKFIRESVDRCHTEAKTKMQYEQFGWKDENTSFLYGDRLYRPGSAETVACSSELRFRSDFLRPTPNGSVDGWKQAADNLMGLGSEGMSFTILCSFGAVLMRFLEDNEGGALVHLVTKASGAGKTTSLAAAYTVWARDPRAIVLANWDTKVSKFVSLGAMGNLPVIFDEFENKDPSILRELVMIFSAGRDKMRSDASGQIIHSAASWQTMMISAANKSLVELIMSTSESDAPALRILEFPVESAGQLSISEAAKYKKQLEDNAGHAGHAFISYLVRPEVLTWARAHMATLANDIFASGAFRKEHRYWVRALAAAGTAAVIVSKLELIAFNPKRIMSWAIRHFAGKVPAVNVEGPPSSLPMFSRFLNAMVGETLSMQSPSFTRKAVPVLGEKPRYRVSVRTEAEGGMIYVSEAVLRDWVAKNGGGYDEMIAEMKEKTILIKERKLVTLTAGTELRTGQVQALQIDGDHPALTGVMRAATGATPLDDARKRLQEHRQEAKLHVVSKEAKF